MRGAGIVFVGAIAFAAACSAGPPTTEAPDAGTEVGEPPIRTGTLDPIDPPVTILVQEALPAVAPVPGEPESYADGPGESAPNTGRIGEVDVELPVDYLNRPDLILCVHSEDLGWHGCSAADIQRTQILNTASETVSVVLLREGGEFGFEPLRRLAVLSVVDARDINWRIVDGYETLAELVSAPPPPDGMYLEAVS